MDERSRQELTEAGIDVADVTERFMNNEALVEKFLKKFINDDNYQKLVESLAADEVKDAFTAAHTLKGVCGNLGMQQLFEVVSSQTEMLRAGNLAEAKAVMPEITEKYEKIISAIKSWTEQ